MTPSLAHQLAVEQTGPDEFTSKNPPVRMGNAAPIAYGGSTLGIVVSSAYGTVTPPYKLYSLVGHFLGPANLDNPLRCRVTRTRDTKSFATRRVEVSQVQRDGKARVVMEATADFHVVEPAMYEYSAPPRGSYDDVASSPDSETVGRQLIQSGAASEKQVALSANSFAAIERFCDHRLPPQSLSAQNLNGLAKGVSTPQDDLPITERLSGEWYRVKAALANEAEHMACLAFLMDGGLSFLPLAHDHKFITESGPCSSLDFAVRFLTPNVNLNEWGLKERVTIAAGYGRNYSEGRMWDDEGNMISSMTQQSILRPPPPKASL
jgi:acyl-CoA thioesterase II